MTAQHTSAAATPRASRMYILLFTVKNHQSAILMHRRNIEVILFLHQLTKKTAAHKSEITCENHIIVRGKCVRVTKKVRNSFACSRGKCQEKTIIFFKIPKPLILLGFRHLIYGCSYGVVGVKHRPYGNFIVSFSQKDTHKFDIKFCRRKLLS